MADVEATAADLIDKWATKLAEVAEQHGPNVADLALSVGQIGALQHVITATVFVAIGSVLVGVGIALLRKVKGPGKYDFDEIDGDVFRAFGSIVFLLSGGVILAINVASLLNVYAWVGLWHPEIYLAAKALNL